jgi:hypothetical protein
MNAMALLMRFSTCLVMAIGAVTDNKTLYTISIIIAIWELAHIMAEK